MKNSKIVDVQGKPFPVAPQVLPEAAAQSLFGVNAYTGASRVPSLAAWHAPLSDADTANSGDLPTLRARSNDLIRNAPIASGAIDTKVTYIVGAGFKHKSQIDKEAVGLNEEDVQKLERTLEREFKLWSKHADIGRTQSWRDDQEMALRSPLVSGDAFVLRRFQRLPNSPYGTKIQIIEGDQVSNPNNSLNTANMVDGVEKDENGAPIAYWMQRRNPGSLYGQIDNPWIRVPAFDDMGRSNVLQLFRAKRPGQTRGVPDLAPVIETLKQLSRYTEAELMAAVTSGMFTVFVKTPSGRPLNQMYNSSYVGDVTGKQAISPLKLGYGAIANLNANEEVEFADPNRPNTAFDSFVLSVSRQVGAALGIPFELLVKHFTASYSASRAALLDAWKHFMVWRMWLEDHFLNPVYEMVITESVALGRVSLPGFFDDPLMRAAYLGSKWIGPSKGMIDELKEVKAAQLKIDARLSTHEDETATLNGGDHEKNVRQLGREKSMHEDAGLVDVNSRPLTTEEMDTDGPDKNNNNNNPATRTLMDVDTGELLEVMAV